LLIGDMALTSMALGDKAAALALAQKATAARPLEKDAIDGSYALELLARVLAQAGEPDRAITAIQKLLSIPSSGSFAVGIPLTPAVLRLDPMFDPLRDDPRFEKLVALPAPKTAGKSGTRRPSARLTIKIAISAYSVPRTPVHRRESHDEFATP
jgi:tetratricopeptide (TPR) repeat protein